MVLATTEPRSTLYRMAVETVGGDLRAYLAVRRAEGYSFDQIAREISAKGVTVSGTNVSRWAARLGVHKPERRSA